MHHDPQAFAHDWIAAWNSHDLDRIPSHYAENVILTSPAAAKLLNDPSGIVTGVTGRFSRIRAKYLRGSWK